MERRSVLVTGGNSGIGLECARSLARAGRHVLIASRDRSASEAAVRGIAAESGAGRIEALQLDLASLDSIRALVAELESRDLALDALVCNAGIQFFQGPVRNAQGYELTFATNHLGHFLLTNLLLARLAANAPARIVVVASGVHDPERVTGMPKPDVTTIETLARSGGPDPDGFHGGLAYVNSKLCNLWFAYELDRRLQAAGLSSAARPIAVNAFDPGLVPGSGLARDYHPALRWIWNRILPAVATALSPLVAGINPAPKSGAALARLVTDPALAAPGARYYPSHTRWKETPSSKASYDTARWQELWETSVAMSGLAPGDSPLIG
jgi:light-dependent protochlorophyllide reductase